MLGDDFRSFGFLRRRGNALEYPSAERQALRRRQPRRWMRVDPDDYDLLVIPGGKPDGAPTTVRNRAHARAITRSFFAKDKAMASICHGPYHLVSADVVRRRLTSYWGDGVPRRSLRPVVRGSIRTWWWTGTWSPRDGPWTCPRSSEK